MRHCAVTFLSLFSLLTNVVAGPANSTVRYLAASFTPPAVFENTNLVRNINLEKAYPREVLNIELKNVGKDAQDEYYLEFPKDLISKIGGLVVRDRERPESPPLKAELAQYESSRLVNWFLVLTTTKC